MHSECSLKTRLIVHLLVPSILYTVSIFCLGQQFEKLLYAMYSIQVVVQYLDDFVEHDEARLDQQELVALKSS